MAQIPRSFVGDVKVARQLASTHAFSGICNKSNRQYPFRQRKSRTMHNSTRCCGKLVLAISTFVKAAFFDSISFDRAAFRTSRPIRPSKGFQKFQTFIARVVLLSERNKANWLRIRSWRRHFRAFLNYVLTERPKYRYNNLDKLSLSALRSRLGLGAPELLLRCSSLKVKTQAGPHGYGHRLGRVWTRLPSGAYTPTGYDQAYTAKSSFRGPLLASHYSFFTSLVLLRHSFKIINGSFYQRNLTNSYLPWNPNKAARCNWQRQVKHIRRCSIIFRRFFMGLRGFLTRCSTFLRRCVRTLFLQPPSYFKMSRIFNTCVLISRKVKSNVFVFS